MEGIPPEVGAVLRPVLPDLAGEMIREIGAQVPDYSRPLEGPFGVTLRYGVERALRRFVDTGVRAGLEPETLYRVGEAIFSYIDEISGESIEGYAAEQSAMAGEGQRRREQLVRLLAADPPPTPEALRSAADHASWALPARIAALVVEGVAAERLAGRLGPGAVA